MLNLVIHKVIARFEKVNWLNWHSSGSIHLTYYCKIHFNGMLSFMPWKLIILSYGDVSVYERFIYVLPACSLVKVKQFHHRPWQALRVPGGWGSQILSQLAHEGGRVVIPTHQIPVTPSGIDPMTFRFVVQCLNHCATAYPACSLALCVIYSAFMQINMAVY
jgi:hypothetical protein